ncbi:MAG: LysR family transcriptional regulator [Lachnospiraceae bacterium]|nr:LysR family transcriptional regulator [Lachnospiraceae bacterium]
MNSKELLYVKTVADEQNISRAAKKLFMAQPSLSQSIQRIEESVGTPLFNRTPTGLTLTFSGEQYYQMATQVLKIYEDFEMTISDINNLKTGRIHFGITNHLGTLVLAKVLPEFQTICSNVELKIYEENSTELEKMLLAGKLDFCIMHTPTGNRPPTLHYDVMTHDPFVIAMAKEHPLAAQAVETPGYPYPVLDLKLLKDEPFLMLHREQRIRQITDAVLNRAGITQPRIALSLRNFETAQLLAARGLGVTLVPLQYSRITSSRAGSPALFCIDNTYEAGWDMCITTQENRFLSKADQLFIRLVRRQFS